MAEEHSGDKPTFKSIREGGKGETLDSLEEKGKRLFIGDEAEKFNSLLVKGRSILLRLEQINIEGDMDTIQDELSTALSEYCLVKQAIKRMITPISS